MIKQSAILLGFALVLSLIASPSLAGSIKKKTKKTYGEGIRLRPHIGFGSFASHGLENLKVPAVTGLLGITAGYQSAQGAGFDLELGDLNASNSVYGSGFRDARTSISQQRLAGTAFYQFRRKSVFRLNPQIGVARNQFTIELAEDTYKKTARAVTTSVHGGCNLMFLAGRRVIIDLQLQVAMMPLKISALGIDETGYQLTASHGVGWLF